MNLSKRELGSVNRDRGNMWKLAFQRLTIMLVMLLLVSVIAFCVPMLSDGDPARTILLANSNSLDLAPEAVEALRIELGLDRPLAVQYLTWLGNAVTGDFGRSFGNRQPVGEEILAWRKTDLPGCL